MIYGKGWGSQYICTFAHKLSIFLYGRSGPMFCKGDSSLFNLHMPRSMRNCEFINTGEINKEMLDAEYLCIKSMVLE